VLNQNRNRPSSFSTMEKGSVRVGANNMLTITWHADGTVLRC
jgi:hypothetical protein